MYDAYSYCKLFHCSLAEYEARPHRETRWMLEIDKAYNQAVKDVNEKASRGG